MVIVVPATFVKIENVDILMLLKLMTIIAVLAIVVTQRLGLFSMLKKMLMTITPAQSILVTESLVKSVILKKHQINWMMETLARTIRVQKKTEFNILQNKVVLPAMTKIHALAWIIVTESVTA